MAECENREERLDNNQSSDCQVDACVHMDKVPNCLGENIIRRKVNKDARLQV